MSNFMRGARWICSNYCEKSNRRSSFLRRLFLSVNSKLFTAKTHMETDYLYKDSQMNFILVFKLGEALIGCAALHLDRLDGPSNRPDPVVSVAVEPGVVQN